MSTASDDPMDDKATSDHQRLSAVAASRTEQVSLNPDLPLIVAIGASAGGLEPLEQFFEAIDDALGCSFIVVQHLSPDFRSMMDELLARHTKMPIERITNGLKIEPDHIYLNVPRVTVTINSGHFRLASSNRPMELYRPIDLLFGSVAEQYGKNAIGLVLSGTGSDGTEGAEKLKQFGGQVLVQAPESARFESMPRSVVDARIEDSSGTAAELANFVRRWVNGERLAMPQLIPVEGDPIGSIIALIRRHTSLDFERYKPATVQRRVERRASLQDNGDLNAYYKRVVSDPEELDRLYSDMLIEVTSFFRDQKAFDAVEEHAMPGLMEKLARGEQLRMWIAGCASGEEAYSLAMLLIEHAEQAGLTLDARILATDAHGRSLANANAGRFPRESIRHLSKKRVNRYFEIHGDSVQIKPEVRKLLLFSTHDVIRDTPFTQIDLLSCRNLLIYLTTETQEQVISKFHFALHKGGCLLLGPSESTVGIADEFDILDSRWRLYKKRRNVTLQTPVDLTPLRTGGLSRTRLVSEPAGGTRIMAADGTRPLLPDGRTLRFKRAHQFALERMIAAYAPPGFLLTSDGDVVHVFGDAGALIPVGSGAFTQRLTEMVRSEFRASIFSALQSAQQPLFERFERRLHTEGTDGDTTYDMTLTRVNTHEPATDGEGGFLLLTVRKILEQEMDPTLVADPMTASLAAPGDPAETAILLQRIRALEQGLGASEESLQTTIEELETSNEELQSTNEELTASNEELQSTNEELQSTNEELHSVNEELFTVSAEHQRQTGELAQANSDIENLLLLSEIGTLHFDRELRLKRYSSAATRLFDLSAANLTRAVDSITARDTSLSLGEIAREVLSSGRTTEQELYLDGRHFLLKAVANKGHDDKIIGVMVATMDSSTLSFAREQYDLLDHDYQAIVEDTGSFIVRWHRDSDLISFCNERYAEMFNLTPEEMVGQTLTQFIPQDERQRFKTYLASIQPGEVKYSRVIRRFDDRSTVTGGFTRAICSPSGDVVAYQSTGQDLSSEYEYAMFLEQLVDVTSDTSLDNQSKIELLLGIGAQFFGTTGGIVGRHINDQFEILALTGEVVSDFRPGDSMPINQSFSGVLTSQQKLFQFHKAELADPSQHVAVERTGLRSYIGTIVESNGAIVGSLAFGSRAERDSPFEASHQSLLRLIANWVSILLEGIEKNQG